MLEDIGDVDTKSTFLPWQNMAEGSILGEFTSKALNWDEDRDIVLPLRPYLPLMLSV